MLVLQATSRDQDVRLTRKEGRIPGSIYGPSFEAQKVSVDYQEFRKAIREIKLHKVFELDIDGKKVSVIVKDFDQDKVKDTFTHIDFYAIDEKKEVIVPVPVSFEGESEALKVGALLTVVSPTVKIKVLPKNIPANLVADISILQASGDKIRVGNIKKVEGVEFIFDDNVMIAKAEMSRAAKKAAGDDGDEEEGMTETVETTEEAATEASAE